MKICIISPYPPQKDGIGIYSKKIADLLAADKNKVFVISTPSYKSKKIFRYISFSIFDFIKAILLLQKERQDIIHVQYAIPAFGIYNIPILVLLAYIKIAGFGKSVVTFHEVKRETDLLGYFGKLYFQVFSKLFAQILVHTQEAQKILTVNCGIAKSKIRIIPHGIYSFSKKADFRTQIIKKYGIKDKHLILFFGYIHIDKGIQYLIRAILQLKKSSPQFIKNCAVLIAGTVRERKGLFKIFEKKDRYYFEDLKKMVNEFDLSNVIKFTGHIEDKYVYSLFKLSKVVVLPYEKTEQSGVLNIALAAGRPVIASAIGGLKETLAEAGILVQPGNYQQIAQALKKLVEDKNFYQKMEKEYKKLSESLKNKNVLNKLLNVYRRVLNYEI